MLLHQETISLFALPEWRDRPQGAISPPPLPQPIKPFGSNLWSLTTSTTSMYPWSLFAQSTWTPLHRLPQVMVRSSDRSTVWFETYCGCFICCPGGTLCSCTYTQTQKQVVFSSFFYFETYSFYLKGARAELGSRPSMEGPMDPTGPAEYTEQTLDTDSQVGFL